MKAQDLSESVKVKDIGYTVVHSAEMVHSRNEQEGETEHIISLD